MIPTLPPGFSHPMRIGGGAFASVYRVRQASVDRWVALKVIEETDRDRRRAVLKEATTQARMHLSCVPQVYDAFEWKKSVCIAMQWIKGASLAELLQRDPSRQQRMWLADGFIRALARLHAEGYAHRDLKPANVVVSPSDGIYLVDFGLTKHVRDPEKSMTGVVKGTPAYMAPELWRAGGDTDHMRADVYSAGLILREILAGDESVRFADALVKEDPRPRPASGWGIQSLWETGFTQAVPTPGWHELAGPPTARLHAKNLLAAARELLAGGRHDEAYWLLVECLEEDPEYGEAVELMEAFPALSRRKAVRRSVVVALAACAIAAIIVGVFFAGRQSSAWQRIVGIGGGISESGITLLKSTRAGNRSREGSAAFLEDSLPAAHLSGCVVVKSFPADGELSIDGRPIGPRANLRQGIPLAFGKHVLRWKVDGRGVIWRERIAILPFEVKGLTIRERL
ncbi:MAG: protein kinase [Chitinivibrionales bacterium]|nr:protein kinase [Chitinivibrionales bacterium]MBD3396984.1 protein kinase [Chitinivibrionales bacterium]